MAIDTKPFEHVSAPRLHLNCVIPLEGGPNGHANKSNATLCRKEGGEEEEEREREREREQQQEAAKWNRPAAQLWP